jgi:hypothetical protein
MFVIRFLCAPYTLRKSSEKQLSSPSRLFHLRPHPCNRKPHPHFKPPLQYRNNRHLRSRSGKNPFRSPDCSSSRIASGWHPFSLSLVYCRDFSVTDDSRTRLFVDATPVWTSQKNPVVAGRILLDYLQDITIWTNAWKVKPNPLKSHPQES